MGWDGIGSLNAHIGYEHFTSIQGQSVTGMTWPLANAYKMVMISCNDTMLFESSELMCILI